jgi:hypothetical protein
MARAGACEAVALPELRGLHSPQFEAISPTLLRCPQRPDSFRHPDKPIQLAAAKNGSTGECFFPDLAVSGTQSGETENVFMPRTAGPE